MEPLKQQVVANGDEYRVLEKEDKHVLYRKDGHADTVVLAGNKDEVLKAYAEAVGEDVCECGRAECDYPDCETGIADRIEMGDLETAATNDARTSFVRALGEATSHSEEATTVSDTEHDVSESDAAQPHDEDGNIEPSETASNE